jgi:hypothetical protein
MKNWEDSSSRKLDGGQETAGGREKAESRMAEGRATSARIQKLRNILLQCPMLEKAGKVFLKLC